jgi:methyl-accepting chemotaxis protein
MVLDTGEVIRGSLSLAETTDSGSPTMDQELISYFEAHFRESSQQIAAFREETKNRFEQMGGRIDKMGGRIDEMGGRIDEMGGRIDEMGGRITQMETRLDRVEEGVRHNGVQIEGLRDQVQLVAEGYSGIEERLQTLRVDMEAGFKEVRASVRLPFEHLDGRLRVLEDLSRVRGNLGENPL